MDENFLNIFRNYIPNKKFKCIYRQPPWMNENMKRKLKQRSKETKYFFKTDQIKCDHVKILEKSAKCNGDILEAKKNYIFLI